MASLPDDTRAWIATSPDTTTDPNGLLYQRDDEPTAPTTSRPHSGWSVTSPGRARLAQRGGVQ